MPYSRASVLFLLVCFSFFWHCNKSAPTKSDYVATFENEYLLSSDIASVVPPGLETKDSLRWVKEYAASWVKNKLMARKAKKELDDSVRQSIALRVEEYREELLLNEFNNQLVAEFDVDSIPEKEIIAYYNANAKSFVLQKPLVQYRYLVVKNQDAQKALGLLNTNDSGSYAALKKIAENSGKPYSFTPPKTWNSLEELTQKIQFSSDFNPDLEQLLRYKFYSHKDSTYTYLIGLNAIKNAGETSPLPYVKSSIKNVLLKKSKLHLLERFQAELFSDAKDKNEFHIAIP